VSLVGVTPSVEPKVPQNLSKSRVLLRRRSEDRRPPRFLAEPPSKDLAQLSQARSPIEVGEQRVPCSLWVIS
jgi:hypothetical protein